MPDAVPPSRNEASDSGAPAAESAAGPGAERGLAPAARRALEEAQARRAAAQARDPDEQGGPSGPEPTRYGDWERKGIAVDF